MNARRLAVATAAALSVLAAPASATVPDGAIVDLQAERVLQRVAERGITVTLTDAARELIGELGYDPTYGARPLKRVMQKQLVDRLAMAILDGDFREGDVVAVDAGDGELTFTKGAVPAAASAA